MLKKFSFTLLIISFVLISCAKKDDDSSSSTITYGSSTSGATASGSITIGSDTISGTYATACGASSGYSTFPTDATHASIIIVVTGDDSFTKELNFYTDSTCTASVLSAGWYFTNDNGTIGDLSGSDYKVTYTQENFAILANTTAGETYYEAMFSSCCSIDLTVGTKKVVTTGATKYNLVRVSGNNLYLGDPSTSSYPSTGGEGAYVKQ